MPTALTPKDVDDILTIIEEHTAALLFDITGDASTIDPNVFFDIKRKGLIKDLPEIDGVHDSWAYGYLLELLGDDEVMGISIDELKKRAKAITLSTVEQSAIQQAREHAGVHITNLGNRLKEQTQFVINDINNQFNQAQMHQVVRDVVAEGLQRQESRSAVVTQMRRITGDQTNDWHRVVHTELQDARIKGQAATIAGRKGVHATGDGEDSMVFRRPAPDACKDCNRLYLEADGVTPKIFTLRELMANGSNVGKIRALWLPVVGTTHPFCVCALQRLPEDVALRKKLEKTLKRKASLGEYMRAMQNEHFDPHGALVYV